MNRQDTYKENGKYFTFVVSQMREGYNLRIISNDAKGCYGVKEYLNFAENKGIKIIVKLNASLDNLPEVNGLVKCANTCEGLDLEASFEKLEKILTN